MVHHIQATVAFVRDRRNVRFHTLGRFYPSGAGGWAELIPLRGGESAHWWVADGARFEALAERTDLSRRGGRPLIVANAARRVIGVAVGPAVAPRAVQISGVFDLERQVFIAGDDGQPEWWLCDATPSELPMSSGASAMVASWKADFEARRRDAGEV